MTHYATPLRHYIENVLDFSQTSVDGLHTVRWSVDGTRGVIHWEGATPDGLIDVAMTEDECRELMLTEEWTPAIDESLIVVLGEPFELPDNGINP